MDKKESLKRLKNLRKYTEDSGIGYYAQALDYAINRLEESALELPVQEHLITKIIDDKLDKFKKFQSVLFIIQTLMIVIFTITLFKEREFLKEIIKQLEIFKELISVF